MTLTAAQQSEARLVWIVFPKKVRVMCWDHVSVIIITTIIITIAMVIITLRCTMYFGHIYPCCPLLYLPWHCFRGSHLVDKEQPVRCQNLLFGVLKAPRWRDTGIENRILFKYAGLVVHIFQTSPQSSDRWILHLWSLGLESETVPNKTENSKWFQSSDLHNSLPYGSSFCLLSMLWHLCWLSPPPPC